MAEIIWSREALVKLRDIRSYIGQFDPTAAERVAVRMIEAADSLKIFPNRGRFGADGTRELPSIRPYIIVYEVVGNQVVILDLRHSAQQRPDA